MSLSSGEAKRKLVHIAVGLFALLLRWLTWPQAAALAAAAFLFNWQVLPRIGGRALWRGPEQERGYARGILLYPLSVLGLVLFFHSDADLYKVAAVWGVMAFGDGMASLLGQAAGGPRLPWNPAKGWTGFVSFLVFGTLGSSVLMAWTLRLPLASVLSPRILALSLPLAIVCALTESVPTTLDDNLTVPLVGGVWMALVAPVEFGALISSPVFVAGLVLGLAVNGALAALAFATRSIDAAGAVSAVIIGTAITVGLGLRGLAVMIAFFVVGSAVTKLGYRIKAARGIAQERGGARGWRNAWANGGVPAFLALLAGAYRASASEGLGVGGAALVPAWFGYVLTIAFAAAVATAAADTCSSEVGKAYGRRTFLITNLKPVAPGTEGAVSLEGTLGGLGGGALVAAAGALCGLYPWPLAALVALAGLLGSLAESVIGSVAERRGWLDNDLLNALNTAIGGALAGSLLPLAHPVLGATTLLLGAAPR
jgi:uncharacterized protein (TIGR00297 family)